MSSNTVNFGVPTYADRFWDLMLAPLILAWTMVPTFVRVQLSRIPGDMAHMVLCCGWTLLVYYCLGHYLYTTLSPYVGVPIWVEIALNSTMEFKTKIAEMPVRDWIDQFSFNKLVLSLYGFIALVKVLFGFQAPTPEPITYYEQAKNFFVGERAMKGSDFIPVKTLPKFVAKIMTESGQHIGMTWRLESAILTAAHVVQDEEDVYIVTDNGKVRVVAEKWKRWHLDDIAYAKLSEKEFSILGLSTTTLEHSTVEPGDIFYAQCYGPGAFSMGSVSHTPLFGKVVYNGSTAHGFSGSPYLIHKRVLGMHLGYGSQNVGISSAYLLMKLSTVDESSEDVMLKQIALVSKRGKAIEYRISPGDPEEVEFKWGRGYRVLPKEDFFGVYVHERAPTQYSQDMAQRLAPNTIAGNEFVDSKNGLMASASKNVDAGASGKISVKQSSAPTRPAPNAPQIPTTSDPQIGTKLAMEHLASMHVPQRNRSDSMSSTTSITLERKKTRRQKAKQRASKSFEASTPAGQHGLQLIR